MLSHALQAVALPSCVSKASPHNSNCMRPLHAGLLSHVLTSASELTPEAPLRPSTEHISSQERCGGYLANTPLLRSLMWDYTLNSACTEQARTIAHT